MKSYNKQTDYYQKKEEFVYEVVRLHVIYQNIIYVSQVSKKWIISEIIDGLIDHVYFLGEKFEDDYISLEYILGLQKNLNELERLALAVKNEVDAKEYQDNNEKIQLLIGAIESGFEETDPQFDIAAVQPIINSPIYIYNKELCDAKTKQVIRKMY